MKKFIFAFSCFILVICLALLIINFPNAQGDIDSHYHLHLDIWVNTFNNALKHNNEEGLIGSMNYLMDFTSSKFPIPALKELGIVGMWVFTSMVQIINVVRAVVTTFTTPVIF